LVRRRSRDDILMGVTAPLLFMALCLLEAQAFSFTPRSLVAPGLRGGVLPLGRGGASRPRPFVAPRLVAGDGEGEGEQEDLAVPFSSTPPEIDPSVFLPPGLAPPGKSRYEGFYKSEGEAIDVDAEQDGDGEVANNPFFVGYSPDELGFIWDVHLTTVGERNYEEEEEKDSEALPGMLGGGLHDLIMEACNEADKEKEKDAEGGA